jgi:hypothetical protein
MRNFEFSGRQPTTHNGLSAMILRFPKPDSRDVLQTPLKSQSTQISEYLHININRNPTVNSKRTTLSTDQ